MKAEVQPPEDVHPEMQAKEKTEINPIAPAQSEMPETIVNTEKETISEEPEEPEKEVSQSMEEEKSGTVQLKDARKAEEKVSSEPEIVQNETENVQEEQLPGQMNLPADYPGTESIEVVGKAMPRKDYFDTLTAWGLSVYLSKYLPADILADQKKLYQWMQKLVDERGYEFEQEGGTDA